MGKMAAIIECFEATGVRRQKTLLYYHPLLLLFQGLLHDYSEYNWYCALYLVIPRYF